MFKKKPKAWILRHPDGHYLIQTSRDFPFYKWLAADGDSIYSIGSAKKFDTAEEAKAFFLLYTPESWEVMEIIY